MKAFDRLFTSVTTCLDVLGGWLILPMISILIMVDVVLRYVFNSPFIWTLEFSEWALLLVFLFALPECTRVDGHIRMDLVINHLSVRVRAVLNLAYCGVGIWIFYLLGRHEWEEFQFSFELGRASEYLGLPLWVHNLAMLLTSVLMSILFAALALKSILRIRSGKPDSVAETR
jgi:TRAP-type C4-dicarboxylate transport system permease small subunit